MFFITCGYGCKRPDSLRDAEIALKAPGRFMFYIGGVMEKASDMKGHKVIQILKARK